MAAALVDAGALIALLDRSDEHHQRSVEVLAATSDTLVTVLPAVTEAMHILSDAPRAQEAVLDMIDDGMLSVAPLEVEDFRRIKTLMRKYRDRPMDFADAALVRIAERDKLTSILTFDDDFTVYALPGRTRFVLLAKV